MPADKRPVAEDGAICGCSRGSLLLTPFSDGCDTFSLLTAAEGSVRSLVRGSLSVCTATLFGTRMTCMASVLRRSSADLVLSSSGTAPAW